MNLLKIYPESDVRLEEQYSRAVTKWLGEEDQHQAEINYRELVFPLSCERIRRLKNDSPPLELLFVPVGTQAFGPILGIVANPARVVALLETEESAAFGIEVESAFAKEADLQFIHCRINGSDLVDIGEKMKAIFASRGLPSSAHVGADITGGRKTMTAAIAGVGSLYKWRMYYVEAKYERQRMGFGHHEQVIELPNVLDIFGTHRRDTALALLLNGASSKAIESIEDIAHDSAASREDNQLLAIAKAVDHFRNARFGSLLRCVRKQPLNEIVSFDDNVIKILSDIDSTSRTAKTAQSAALLLVARARLIEGDELGTRILIGEACRIIGRAIIKPDDNLRSFLKGLRSNSRLDKTVRALLPLEKFFIDNLKHTASKYQ